MARIARVSPTFGRRLPLICGLVVLLELRRSTEVADPGAVAHRVSTIEAVRRSGALLVDQLDSSAVSVTPIEIRPLVPLKTDRRWSGTPAEGYCPLYAGGGAYGVRAVQVIQY